MQNENFIINARACQYQWSGECFLSIKSFTEGAAHYKIHQREYAVNDTNFLVLNECTNYTLTIDSKCEVDSFCIFFAPAFVTQALADISATLEEALDNDPGSKHALKLTERNFLRSGAVSNLLSFGKQHSQHFDSFEWTEFYHSIFYALIQQHTSARKDAERLHLKKRTSRDEMYRRLCYAKDFIDCNFSSNLSLREVAHVAMLSENHLLRNFKTFFGTSPFSMISGLRMAEAKRQIIATNKPISQIASDVGYESLSNFSHAFSLFAGLSPGKLREKVK